MTLALELTKSFYYKRTVFSPVQPTDEQLERWKVKLNCISVDPDHARIANKVKELSIPFAFTLPEDHFIKKNLEETQHKLEEKGWKLLKTGFSPSPKITPDFSVIQHSNFSQICIEHTGASRYVEAHGDVTWTSTGDSLSFNTYASLLSFVMQDIITSACLRNPQKLEGITLPKRHLCEIDPTQQDKPIEQRFVTVTKKVDCLSMEETVDAIDQMSQEEQEALADKLALLVQETGFANASFANIRLGKEDDVTKEGVRRIYIVNPRPSNLLIFDNGMKRNAFTLQSSYEKSWRIGLSTLQLMTPQGETTKATHFRSRMDEHVAAINHPQYSSIRIIVHVISILAMGILSRCFGTRKWKVGLIVTILAPIEVGTARWIGATLCETMEKQQQQPQIISEEDQRRLNNNRNFWRYYQAWFIGEGRRFETPAE